MPTHDLHVNLELDNIATVVPQHNVNLCLKVQCTGCRHMYDEVYMDPAEEHDLFHGRGTAHLVLKCRGCKADITATFEQLSKGSDTWDDAKFIGVISDTSSLFAQIKIRNGTIESFTVQSPFVATGTQGDKFEFEIDEEGFYDVDRNYDSVSVVLQSFELK